MAADDMIPEDRRDVAREIREYLVLNPHAGNAEVAVFLERDGLHASPALIQQVRWDLARQREPPSGT